MNIIVCVKQTPEAGKGEMDQIRGTVRRDADRQVINPFDLYAMEAALRLQEEDPSTRIIALSMGPASAGSVLRRFLRDLMSAGQSMSLQQRSG